MYQDALTYQDATEEYNYITDDQLSVRELEGPDHSLIDFPTHVRAVVPMRRPDDRLIHEEAALGWELAQQLQTIQSVFYDLFEAGKPTSAIKKRAFAMIDALVVSDHDANTVETLTSHIQGAIDACWQGEKFGIAKWWPGRQGHPHARAEAPQAPQEDAPKKMWFWSRTKKNARVLARKAGDKVEILEPRPEQKQCKPYTVKAKQAKNLLALEYPAADNIQVWANAQWELAQ